METVSWWVHGVPATHDGGRWHVSDFSWTEPWMLFEGVVYCVNEWIFSFCGPAGRVCDSSTLRAEWGYAPN